MKTQAYRWTIGWVLGLALVSLGLTGCSGDNNVISSDGIAPATPQGVYSITGNELVTLVWTGSTETGLEGYLVLRSNPGDDFFDVIAEVFIADYTSGESDFIEQWVYDDLDVVNGAYYEYAVVAFDFDGDESEPSDIYGRVIDIPRPDGFNVRIDSRAVDNAFDFSARRTVSETSVNADIVVNYDEQLGTLFLESSDEDIIELQDFGFTDAMDDLDFAPQDGWSGLGWSELIVGHSYVVRIFDGPVPNYAKLRVSAMGSRWVRIDWAYQLVEGERQLKRVPRNGRTGLRREHKRYPKNTLQRGR